jgi:hypothetical protein
MQVPAFLNSDFFVAGDLNTGWKFFCDMDSHYATLACESHFHRIRVRYFPVVNSGSRFRSFTCIIKGTYGTNLAKNDQLLFA